VDTKAISFLVSKKRRRKKKRKKKETLYVSASTGMWVVFDVP
jgi:hypothetical protein